jgi:hypothetical protein
LSRQSSRLAQIDFCDLFLGGIAMVKPAVSREAFRGLFALYAAKAHTITSMMVNTGY